MMGLVKQLAHYSLSGVNSTVIGGEEMLENVQMAIIRTVVLQSVPLALFDVFSFSPRRSVLAASNPTTNQGGHGGVLDELLEGFPFGQEEDLQLFVLRAIMSVIQGELQEGKVNLHPHPISSYSNTVYVRICVCM